MLAQLVGLADMIQVPCVAIIHWIGGKPAGSLDGGTAGSIRQVAEGSKIR